MQLGNVGLLVGNLQSESHVSVSAKQSGLTRNFECEFAGGLLLRVRQVAACWSAQYASRVGLAEWQARVVMRVGGKGQVAEDST